LIIEDYREDHPCFNNKKATRSLFYLKDKYFSGDLICRHAYLRNNQLERAAFGVKETICINLLVIKYYS
jgi:hypothetical protein